MRLIGFLATHRLNALRRGGRTPLAGRNVSGWRYPNRRTRPTKPNQLPARNITLLSHFFSPTIECEGPAT